MTTIVARSARGGARFPLGPTILTALVVPALIALGLWQLQRREEKAAALAAFARPVVVEFRCAAAYGPERQTAGFGPGGREGWSHRVDCGRGPGRVTVDLGWSPRPLPAAVTPPVRLGAVRFLIPDHPTLLLSRAPAPPLQPSQPPNIDDIPNNHLSYAVQWFAFAATLLAVYALYVRRWRRERT